MAITARTGTGTTMTFTGGFTCKVIDSLDPFSQSVGVIDANTMATTDYMQKLAEDFIDLGELSFTIEYEPDENPPAVGVVDTVSINPKGLGAGSLIEGTGFFSAFTPTLPVNGKMTAQVTWTWDGDEFAVNAS